ncbi:MAG: hypothetical protein ACLTCB_04180 [Merdibacter sp.]
MAAAIGGAMAVVSSDDPVEQVQGYYLATAAKERLDIPRNERYQIISGRCRRRYLQQRAAGSVF